MMHKIPVTILFLLGTLIYAQDDYTISGSITDTQDQPISIGDVLLLSSETNTLIKYSTIVNGSFYIEDISLGNYKIQISCLGFEPWERELLLNESVFLEVNLTESVTNLNEVEVIAAKPVVTNDNGNLKIDVTNPVFASIPNSIDLLARLPNVQISPDRESISILGKGFPLIYVGNQRITMEEFNSLSIDDISTVEIIRNPSAKYEADGRAVLLITRKIGDYEGFKINLSETASFKRNFNNYTTINGSFNKQRLTLKANFAYNDLLQWESHQFEFAIPEANILSDYLILVDKNDRVELNSGGGLYYQINDNDYLSINFSNRKQTNDAKIDTDTFLSRDDQEDDIKTFSNNENIKDFSSANLNYNIKLYPQTNLFAGVQYSSYTQRLDTEIANNYNNSGFTFSEQRKQRYNINVLAYRMDIEKTFGTNLKLDFGTNISNANANALTDIQFQDTNMNTKVNYDYIENNNAFYSMLSGELSKNINFNLGLRVENNKVKGKDDSEAIPLVNRESTDLFSKGNLTIKVDSTKRLNFNYAKSISRPNYSNASSIQVFFNPFLEGEGNVNLLPTITEELSGGFQFHNNSITVEYFNRQNPIYYTIGYTAGADRAVFSLKNLEKESGYSINFTVPITKGKWTSSNSISLSAIRIQDSEATGTAATPYVYCYTDHQFKIGKDTTLSLGGWVLTKRSEGIFKRNAMAIFNASITKTFFKKLNCSVRLNDITRGMNHEEGYAINGVVANGVYFVDAQEIAFSLKYNFGQTKDPNYKNKEIDENLNRIR